MSLVKAPLSLTKSNTRKTPSTSSFLSRSVYRGVLFLLMTIFVNRQLQDGGVVSATPAFSTTSRTAAATPAFSSFFPAPRQNSGDQPLQTLQQQRQPIVQPQSQTEKQPHEQQIQRLVLVGGGHAHVQVIKALNKASRPHNMHVTLIDTQTAASYSGMVPGTIAGTYRPEDTLLHLLPLAKWAGIDFVHDKVVDIDVDNKLVHVEGNDSSPAENAPIPFDVISIDIGSASRGLHETPGAMQYTIPTRPIADLVLQLENASKEIQQRKDSQNPVDVVVIGGGAAGLELSMSLWGRWKPLLEKDASRLRITVLDSGDELVPGETPANRAALQAALAARNIHIQYGSTVAQVHRNKVELTNGAEVPFTHCLWATGAGPHTLARRLQARGLGVSDRGWIRVNPYLQSVTHPHVFAAGDCCTIEGLNQGKTPSPPKAGVYAVRSGPILIDNLTRTLDKENQVPLTTYKPQDDFLKLVVCGDGTALGFRFGIPIQGKWVFDLKHRIDSNFMNLFKVENLPDLKDGQAYDTSQYDATTKVRPPPILPKDAATLLQRADDDVDYEKAWNVLKDMNDDKAYRQKVLDCMRIPNEVMVG